MKTEVYDVPAELVETIQAIQYELDGLKNMLGFAYSTTEYVIPESRIKKLEKDYLDTNARYNLAKNEVENIFINNFDRSKTSWNLDFDTKKVTVVEND